MFWTALVITNIQYFHWKWSSGWLESWEWLSLATDVFETCAEATFMASSQVDVVQMSVAKHSRSQDSSPPDDDFQSRYVTPGFKPSYIYTTIINPFKSKGFPIDE